MTDDPSIPQQISNDSTDHVVVDLTKDPMMLGYQPRGLTAFQWQLAKLDAITAVASTGISDAVAGRVLLSTLANFLIWNRAWDRASTPNLGALMTPEFLDRYIIETGVNKVQRAVLRRIARAVGTVPPLTPTSSTRGYGMMRERWASVEDVGSLAALMSAHHRLGFSPRGVVGKVLGQDFDSHRWDTGRLLARGVEVANAPQSTTDTLGPLDRAARELRAAPDVVLLEVSHVSPKKNPTTKKPTKANSRTAVVRDARAAQAVHVASLAKFEAGHDVEPVVAAPASINPELAHLIAIFRPNGIDVTNWELVTDATRVLATAYCPENARWVRTQMGMLARFCVWVVLRPARTTPGQALRPGELLRTGLVEEYLSGPMSTRPSSTRGTVRSALRRSLRNLAPELAPAKFPYASVQPPYSAQECAALVRLARNQPTPATCRNLSAMVGLGLGAGLGANEQRSVAPIHLRDVELSDGVTGLAVTVLGARARTVIVRADYEELLREALALHFVEGRKETDLLYGNSATRQSVAGTVTKSAKVAIGGTVDVSIARMRSTWLVALASAPVSLGALLNASGLRSARTLVDLLQYCPMPSEAEVAVALEAFNRTAVTDGDK
jgi:hypothetical protein